MGGRKIQKPSALSLWIGYPYLSALWLNPLVLVSVGDRLGVDEQVFDRMWLE